MIFLLFYCKSSSKCFKRILEFIFSCMSFLISKLIATDLIFVTLALKSGLHYIIFISTSKMLGCVFYHCKKMNSFLWILENPCIYSLCIFFNLCKAIAKNVGTNL